MMHEILKDRIWRKLETLPAAQLYQVLDYMEFLESRYAPGRAAPPDALQRFAERLEDGMRVRNVAPRVITGTVGLLGTARRVVRAVSDTGRDLLTPTPHAPGAAPAPASVSRSSGGANATSLGEPPPDPIRPAPGAEGES